MVSFDEILIKKLGGKMEREFLKNKIDKIVEEYKSKNKYGEDLMNFENNSIEDEIKLTTYVTERFTKLLWTAWENTKYKEYVILNDVYEALWGTENLKGMEGLLKLIKILEKVLDPTNIIIARNMKDKIKNWFK
jgi:hypothetical protein|nr:MAG TPA: hypothetical protein [Caudoviricetes sp.]